MKTQNKIYQHYRGGLYELLLIAICYASGEKMAIYKSQESGIIWMREYENFKLDLKRLKMPKYFYTDPLKAAWMAREFGFKYLGGDSFKTAIEVAGDNYTSIPFILDKKSAEQCKPQVCDFVEETNGESHWALTAPAIEDEIINLFWYNYKINKLAKIIQRNGKAFFMPEVEM